MIHTAAESLGNCVTASRVPVPLFPCSMPRAAPLFPSLPSVPHPAPAGQRRRIQAAFPFAPHSPQERTTRSSGCRKYLIPLEPAPGFEPGTYGLQVCHSHL